MSTVFIKNMEMAENIQNYTKSDLKFSSSKLYFQHQNQIIQNFWFISPMTIDIHYKYTFQEVHDRYIYIKMSIQLYHKTHQKFAKFYILGYNNYDISYLP